MVNYHLCESLVFIRVFKLMFVAEALFNFSKATMAQPSNQQQQQQPLDKNLDQPEQQEGKSLATKKRERSYSLDKEQKQQCKKEQKANQDEQNQIIYLTFQKEEKILVEQAYQNGWWFGHVIKRPKEKGFFPSNYIKVGAKPPPPPPPQREQSQEQQQSQKQQNSGEQPQKEVYDYKADTQLNQQLEELGGAEKGALTSDYYHGITGYKYVKINENNKGVLNGNYVKYDVATGLARVPVKDQAPCSKAVRQMGYYFDYHQWNQERNRNPEAHRSRPDPKKKKKKRLHLVGMGKEG